MFGKKKDEKILLGNLIEGLPVRDGIDLMFKLNAEKAFFMVPSANQNFEIDFSKLQAVQYYSETEMENIVSQSAPGMIVGAVTFGIIGAMVGGRVKTKKKKNTIHFLVINYVSDGEKQIVMQTNDALGAMKMAEYFKALNPGQGTTTVSL